MERTRDTVFCRQFKTNSTRSKGDVDSSKGDGLSVFASMKGRGGAGSGSLTGNGGVNLMPRKEKLLRFLTYHVVAGAVKAPMLVNFSGNH